MQTFKPILFQNLRRAALVMGLAMFVMFAYKASNEVSNPNIAAGNQRQQTLVAANYGAAGINNAALAVEQSLASLAAVQTDKSTDEVSSRDLTNDLAENKRILPERLGQNKPKDNREVSSIVSKKSRTD